ncbi:MAG: SRPBCC domain-containing protein [Methanomassiliicoccus sp.]|nr:SRPBCC domain-containing protein [Methanomassiliicoccus sp.]
MAVAEQVEREEMVVSRTFDAPRERVWRAWTEPELIKQWWGPKGFTAPVIELDLRNGGKYLFNMRSPEGQDFWSAGVFKEVVKEERITVIDSFADQEGNIVPASFYGLTGAWPLESEVTVTFEDLGGRARIIIRQPGIPAGEGVEVSSAGWKESLDKLAELLRSMKG